MLQNKLSIAKSNEKSDESATNQKKNSNESKPRHSKLSKHSRTLSGENQNKSGGRNSIPFLFEEEKNLAIVKKPAAKEYISDDDPFIANNIDSKLPESIHNQA
jgi:hypothetical protein